jgi:uncharacterized repeat protein (TIGR01451 family)
LGAAAGSVWVVYKDYTTAGSPLQVQGALSSALGAFGTFSPAQLVPGSGDGGFADIAVGPLAQVMVTFQDNLEGTNNSASYPTASVWISVKTNAVPNGILDTNNDFGPNMLAASDAISGKTYIPAAPYAIGVNAAPGLAWDYDASETNFDNVYLIYTGVGPNGNAVISFKSSGDFGTNFGDSDTNWSAEMYVDDDATNGVNDHFLPRVAVDPATGLVACAWYDCRNDLGANSPVITEVVKTNFTFSSLSEITNVFFTDDVTAISTNWSDSNGKGSNITVVIVADNVNGTSITSDTVSNIYIGGVTNTNFVISLAGTNTGTSKITVILTNIFNLAYTSGGGANQEPIMYTTLSLDGGRSFLANQQLSPPNEVIVSPAVGDASDVAGSDSLTGWGHYTGLAAYGDNFYPVWADNSDVTTNNPDGANTNFDIYMLSNSISLPSSDLSIWVTNFSTNAVTSQEVLTYSVILTNHGPLAATNVVVTNILSPSVTPVANGISVALPGTFTTGLSSNGQEQIVFAWATVAANAVLTNTIRVAATTSSLATNFASVYSPVLDLVLANNTNQFVVLINGEDLAMGMTTSETNVLIGDTVVTWITVTNLGPATNGPVFITNQYSPNWTNIAILAQGTNLLTNSALGPLAIANVGLLPVGQPVTAMFTAVATSAGTFGDDTYAYQSATVFSQDYDTNLADNSADLVYFINGEDLAIGVTTTNLSVDQGEAITYTINVTNFGLSYSGLVTVTNSFSSNLTAVSATQSQGANIIVNNQVIFSLGILGAGDIATMTVTGVAAIGPPSAALSEAPLVTNIVTVSSTDFDTNLENNVTTSVVPINGEDLAIGMTPSSATVDQGEPVTYTIKVANLGASYSGLVSVTNTLSTNLSQISATQSQGANTITNNQVVFSLGALGAGQVAILTVTAVAPSGPPSTVALSQAPSVANVATVSSTAFDTNLANNAATSAETVNVEHLVLGVSQSSSSVDLGAPVTFTINVTNEGPSYSGLVTVTNILSTNLGQLTATQSQGTNAILTNQVIFSLGAMSAGQIATMTVSAIALSAPASASDFASVSSTDFDTNVASGAVTNLVTVNGEDLAVAVSASPASQQVGQTVTFSETVTNLGLSTNGVVLVTNTFSTNLGTITVVQPATNYTVNKNVVVFNLGELNAGQTVPITMTASPTSAGSGTDTAGAGSLDFDTNLANNTAKATVTITPALPMISNLVVTALASSAFIVWDTGYPTTDQALYGLTSSYGSFSTASSTPSLHHVVLLTGLAQGAVYDFEALAWEGSKLYTTNGSFTTTNTLILDYSDAIYSGNWTRASLATGIYSNYYDFATTVDFNPTAWAIYDPAIPASGLYDVSIWYPDNSTFTTNAQVYVTGPTNALIDSINETVHGGGWQPLATNMYFARGTNGTVILYNDTGDTSKYLVADAMMWAYVAAQDYPTNGAVPAWWANFYFGTNVNGNVNGLANTNGTGYSIYDDYVLGLNPTNGASGFSFTVAPASGNEVSINFSPCQGGRNYQLQAVTNLASPVWTTLTNGFTVNTNGSGTFTVTQTNASGAFFYRLSAQIIP